MLPPLDSIALYQAAVVVEIREVFLVRNPANIRRTLCTYSLDNGSFGQAGEDRWLFRFTDFDWQNRIQTLLIRNHIHYHIHQRLGIDRVDYLIRKRIMVAEDADESTALLPSMLREAGYQVRVAAGGGDILRGDFSWVDLFVVDRTMRDADGLAICRYLREHSATRHTPVILLAADSAVRREALGAGASDVIEKPVLMPYLLNVIDRYVKSNDR